MLPKSSVTKYEREAKEAVRELAERIHQGDEYLYPQLESQTYYGESDGAPGRVGSLRFRHTESGKTLVFDFGLSRGKGYWEGFWRLHEFYGMKLDEGGEKFRTKEVAERYVLASLWAQRRKARP